jgi:DNA-binding transcriptional MocR family regulator
MGWAASSGSRSTVDDVVLSLEHWRTGAGSAYERLSDALAKVISSGELPVGTVLPSERQLASALGVGRGTTANAYRLLGEAGLVERRHGSGTVVLPGHQPVTFALAARHDSPGWIWESVDSPSRGSSTIDLASTWFRTLPDVPDDVLTTSASELRAVVPDHGYILAGLPQLRAAVADRLTGEGLPTTPDEILVTTGALQAIALVASLVLRKRDVVVTESPTYPTALDVFGRLGVHVVTVPSSARGLDLDQLGRLVRRSSPSLVYLVSTSNPAHGGSLTLADRAHVAELVAETDTLLLDDCARADLAASVLPPLAAFAQGDQYVTVGSVSKLYWGGLRVGWLRATPRLIQRVARLKAAADLGSSVPGQLIAAKLLEHGERIREQRLALLHENSRTLSEFLRDRLPEWHLGSVPGATAFIRLPRGSGDAFMREALAHGVSVNPGSVFYPDDRHSSYIRLSLTAPQHELLVGLERLEAASRDYVVER